MQRNLGFAVLFLGLLISVLAHFFQDYLVLSKQIFVTSIFALGIISLFLLFFMSITILSLGQRIVSRKLFLLGLFLISALIPDFFHVLSFPFLPDFITENKRDKVTYLHFLSRTMFIFSLYLSVFSEKLLFEESRSKRFAIFLTLLSFISSIGIVIYYPYFPPVFLHIDMTKPTWYKTVYEVLSAFLFSHIAIYIYRRKVFGELISSYVGLSIGFLALSSFTFSLASHKDAYDFVLVLAYFFRTVGHGLLVYSVLYLSIRRESKLILESTRVLISSLVREKPVKENGVLYLKLRKEFTYGIKRLFIYDLKNGKWIAQVYAEEKGGFPTIDMKEVKRFIQSVGGAYMGKRYHYSIQEDYIVISEVYTEEKIDAESPLKRLHILNVERLITGYIVGLISFEKEVEAKTKELQRLHLLLETSEYVTQADNNIDIFSKHVLERLDSALGMDGSFFYMWNKSAELPERIVFSSNFIENFSDLNVYRLLEKIMRSANLYGIEKDRVYCKFEEGSYQSGVVGFRRSGVFKEEDLLFLKTISNQLFHIIRLMKVIEDLERAQIDIRFLTEYDPLTMLYNRKAIERILEGEIERADKSGESVCILLIDLDSFKVINETYGYHIGDLILKHVAERLKKSVRKFDSVGRFGGDEFIVILPRATKAVVEYIAERLRYEVVSEPVLVEETKIYVDVSITVVCYPLDATSKEELLNLGEALMYLVKKEGRGKIKMVDSSVKELFVNYRKLEKEILEGLESGAIKVFFQEIVRLNTGLVEGFEALMRLRLKEEILPAGKFIHIAERMGIVPGLDIAIIEKVFKILSTRDVGGQYTVFVNLSPQDLKEEFIKRVIELAEFYRINPSYMVFEITEREAVQDMEKLSSFVHRMKDAGFRFAIDDFGSGYASFLYLKRIPVDFLKIDGEFIRSMKRSQVDRIFVKTMVDLARGLGIKTVAEQVEDEETLHILLELGVDYAQGYYFGKPMRAEEKIMLFSSTDKAQQPEV